MRHYTSWTIRIAAVAALGALALTNTNVRAAVGLTSGIDVSNLDRTCKPCDDFFQFVNGGWITKNPIPADYPAWGTFNVLQDHNEAVLRHVAEAAAKSSAAPGTNQRKVGDFYASCMDTAAIQTAGVAPIRPLLDLAANASPANLGTTLAQLQAAGVNVFFRFGSIPDAKNSAQDIAFVGQGGLGLPDRDYYIRTDAKSAALVAAYRAHLAAMFQLLGDSAADAATEAASVFSTEEALAKAQLTIVQRRDAQNTYNKMTLANAEGLAPRIQLAQYVASADADADAGAPVNVAEPAYLQALNTELASLSPQDLHAYLRWHVVNSYATALPPAFADEHWNFFSKTLQGSKAQPPRWQQCVRSTNNNLGEALGQMYVRKAFPPAAKAAALEMVQNIKSVLRDDLSTLSWMSPQTRTLGVKKLDAFLLKIGYPDKWRDYSGLTVVRGPYAANVLAAARFDTAYDNAKIGKPVDRSEWGMTPPTVNAYYNPSINEIVFPAGILQPPFFDANADPAVNYGAIGAVIGHESTHGFDDQGRKYDAYGNLTDWWSAADAADFNARAKCVVDQWNALEPLPGVHEIGAQVEGEEIADLGGLTIAYKAFEKWQSHHPRRRLDGFTPEQRFFMGFGHIWAGSMRPEYVRLLAQSDVHGYNKFRVNQTLSDMPQFAKAFFCKLGDKMVRPASQQCRIW